MYIKKSISKPSRGFAILITFLMFSLFYMLSVVFLINAFIQRILVRNYVNMVKARFVAEAGVHTAIGNILSDFGFFAPAQNKPVNFRWRYEQELPPEYATRPSYAVLDENGTPKLVTISIGDELRQYGYSGYIQSASYGINSDIYHLKVSECSAQLYVNEGLYASGLHPYNTAVIQRVLNTLGELRGVGSNLGDIIIEGRGQGYKNRQELRRVLVSRLGEEDYNKVKDFLCVHTYSDTGVVNPVPLSAHERVRDDYEDALFLTRPLYEGQPFTRYGRGRMNYPDPEDPNNDLGKINQGLGSEAYPLNTTPMVFYGDHTDLGQTFVYAWQELNPCWIEATQRAPVNINTAPREILVALLEGLQGFFVLEQLRTSEVEKSITLEAGDCFRFEYPVPVPVHAIDPYNLPGEIGIIFKTQPIDRTTARQIADRIISARPIYTWQDFNDLIDRMVWLPDRVEPELVDTRSNDELNFFDPDPLGKDNYQLLQWGMYKYYASQAMADVIKANFNPNLHLNELNPNVPLYMMVDKTDLIRNSTEFCFLPTGYFQIESVGRVLRPAQEDGTFTLSVTKVIMRDSLDPEIPNQILGQRRISVEVKLWDLYREGVQRDFLKGVYSLNTSPYHTDLNKACLSGPEVNNGPAPIENGYEGYLQLSTYGGSYGKDFGWQKGRLYTTPTGVGYSDEPFAIDGVQMGMHAHFDFDFRLHSAQSYARPLNELDASPPPGTGNFAWGVPNATEGYDIFDAMRRYRPPFASNSLRRLARSYTYPHKVIIEPLQLAPYDQRIDGFYAERFSMIPYYCGDGNFDPREGTITYWIKPGFFPELHGYHRVFCSLAKGKTQILMYPGHFDHKWGWSREQTEWSEYYIEVTKASVGFTPLVPYSMLFNIEKLNPNFPELQDIWAHVSFTPTLNHRYHEIGDPIWPGDHIPGRRGDIFSHHRWVHVILVWRNKDGEPADSRLLVNGRHYDRPYPYHWSAMDSWPTPDYTTDQDGGLNPFMLGGSRWSKRSANSTIDEFHLATVCGSRTGQVVTWCPECEGEKKVACYSACGECDRQNGGLLPAEDGPITCPECEGTGKCPRCGGDGILEDQRDCDRCLRCSCNPQGKCEPTFRCVGAGRVKRRCYWCRGFTCGCANQGDCADSYRICVDWGCAYCGGWGSETGELVPGSGKCPICDGYGKVKTCDICGCEGTTYIPCAECDGSGEIVQTKEYPYPANSLLNQWERGRYYRENDATFSSQEIYLVGSGTLRVKRTQPVPNLVEDPYRGDRWDSISEQSQITSLVQTKARYPAIKILGVSWTAYTREVMDYKPTEGGDLPDALNVEVEVSLERVGLGHIAGPFLGHEAGWAPVMYVISSADHAKGTAAGRINYAYGSEPGDPNWDPTLDFDRSGKIDIGDVVVANTNRDIHKIRYHVRFNTRCDPLNAILLETPILDDLTIYYTTVPVFISWEESY